MAGFDNQTKVWRERALVRGTSSLLIRVRWWHIVRELARALEHLALVIGTVGVLNFFGHDLDLVRGVRNTNQITPGNAIKGMARSADLLVNEITSPDAVTRHFMRGPDHVGK
jgi:hypothetical protein